MKHAKYDRKLIVFQVTFDFFKKIKMACNFIVLKPECDEMCSYNSKERRITNFTQIEFVQRDFSAD